MAESAPGGRPLIIGLGAEGRGDDGVGLEVARSLRGVDGLAADVLEAPGDLTLLLDLWVGRSRVLLIDAVRSGAPAGTVHRWEGEETASFPRRTDVSSHGLGLAHVLELARSLDRLPEVLVIYGIESLSVGPGGGLSTSVDQAARRARAMIMAEVAGHLTSHETGVEGRRGHA